MKSIHYSKTGILSLLKVCLFFISVFFLKNLTFGSNQNFYSIANQYVILKVTPASENLECELKLTKQEPLTEKLHRSDFLWAENILLDCFFTTWRAPFRKNNSDNAMPLTLRNFQFIKAENWQDNNNNQQLHFYYLDSFDKTIQLKISFFLQAGETHFRQQISLRDTIYGAHFLNNLSLNIAFPATDFQISNPGGFGQPIALNSEKGSIFAGLEYPADENILTVGETKTQLKLKQETGCEISSTWVKSHLMVMGFSNLPNIKNVFMDYLSTIKYAPSSPYTLYNSWYDLRSVEYPRVDSMYHMTEKNVLRILGLIEKNMVQDYGIKLDAFVLDDGWDIYESVWEIRHKQFPNGFKPITRELEKINSKLGLWIGPTGGYSFRKKRIDWMDKNGFEVTGKEYTYNARHLCVGGKKYSEALKKRTSDLVENQKVAYFKLDGFQFSCSNPKHGHPVGIYSRAALVDSVFSLCHSIRELNPDAYLNLTSGTWLSPWWLLVANQIWMDGEDHDWSDVPSISQRDAAITYRDGVLFDDFKTKNLWIPLSNLMTHGLIKGKLELLGGNDDPIDKFTNDAVFYCSRGISMYELYISPDILSNKEWKAIAGSLKWARKNQEILNNTEMVGGNPSEGMAYGYVHFKNTRAIIALRNPSDKTREISFVLDQNVGLRNKPQKLLLEKIYPYRESREKVYFFGDSIQFQLLPYETSIFEMQNPDSMDHPVFTGSRYWFQNNNNQTTVCFFNSTEPIRDISKTKDYTFEKNGKSLIPDSISVTATTYPEPIAKEKVIHLSNNIVVASASFEMLPPDANIVFFIPHEFQKQKLQITATLNGDECKTNIRTEETGTWFKIGSKSSNANISIQIVGMEKRFDKIKIWIEYIEKQPVFEVTLIKTLHEEYFLNLPCPLNPGEERKYFYCGEVLLTE